MNANWIAVGAVVMGGALTALQGPTNARLAGALNSPINAALVSFLVGTVALVMVAGVLQARPDIAAARALPWHSWIGGLYGAVFVTAAAFATPRLGVAATIVLMVAGQMALSLVLDHFGFMGVPKQPIDWGRLAGVGLIVCGVLLIRRP